MVFDKMPAICPDFKWLGLQISDLIWNPDHLQPNLYLTIQNPDWSRFQTSTVFDSWDYLIGVLVTHEIGPYFFMKLSSPYSQALVPHFIFHSPTQPCTTNCNSAHTKWLLPFCRASQHARSSLLVFPFWNPMLPEPPQWRTGILAAIRIVIFGIKYRSQTK